VKLHRAQKTLVHATSPRVVIVGAGFGGLSAAKQLARAPFDVTVVDRQNYHLLQPLLAHIYFLIGFRNRLAAVARRGDRVAYDALLRDCVIPTQRVARRKPVPADRIDDVVQETLLTVHRGAARVRPDLIFYGVVARHRRASRCGSPAADRQARGPRAPRAIGVRKPSG
jgi:choline dehydrogenase-like flavoprotein